MASKDGIYERTSRGRTVYLARVWDPKQRKHRSRTFATREEARRWQRANQVDVDKGLRIVGPAQTLNQHAEAWIAGLHSGATLTKSETPYNAATARRYESAMRRLVLPALGAYRLAEIDRSMIQRLVDDQRKQGRSPTDLRNMVKPLQAIYRDLCDAGELGVNPTSRLKLGRAATRKAQIADPKRPERIRTGQEAAELVAALSGNVRIVYALAFYAGMRIGEIRGLRWEHVDLRGGGVLRLCEQLGERNERLPLKGREWGQTREVPILPELRTEIVLWQLESGRGKGLVCGESARDPFTHKWIRTQADRAWAAAGIERVTPHLARHTFGSLLAASAVPSDDIARMMGQSSEEVRLLYTHALPDSLDRARARVEAFLQEERRRHGS
jgi:integrase